MTITTERAAKALGDAMYSLRQSELCLGRAKRAAVRLTRGGGELAWRTLRKALEDCIRHHASLQRHVARVGRGARSAESVRLAMEAQALVKPSTAKIIELRAIVRRAENRTEAALPTRLTRLAPRADTGVNED